MAVAALTVVALVVALAVQADSALEITRLDGFLGARSAADDLGVQAGAAISVVLLALILPASRSGLLWPVALPAAFVTVVLAATAIAGGHIWDMIVTVLTLACAHGLGSLALGRILGLERLARVVPVTVVVGLGLVGLVVFAFGRLGILEFWSVGIPVAIGGAWVLARGAHSVLAASRQAISAVTSSRLRSAVAGLLLLQLGWASVYVAAPEIQFDALYGKAWLPAHWASAGQIDTLIAHPVLNGAGHAQLVAVPGHTLGSEAVGRYLQLAAVVLIVVALWRFAPLAALAFAVTPQVFWQTSTAYDDLLLVLVVLALALAALELADHPAPWQSGIAVGLIAGTCLAFRYTLVPVAAGIAVGWIVLRGRERLLGRLGGVALGSVIVPVWALAVRWYDTGNPVFPQLNQIFHSPYYPAVDERWNLPYWIDPGTFGPVTAVWKAMVEPSTMLEAAPRGALGVLALAIPLAVLVGWRTRLRGGLALWFGLVVSLVAWWVEFRYLRYVLPSAVVALILIAGAAPKPRLPTGRLAAVPGLALAALLAILFFPSTVASFWNVPGRDPPFRAAAGQVPERDYVSQSLPQARALAALNAVAGPGAAVVGDAHARTLLRDDLDLSYWWEFDTRLLVNGGIPGSGQEALERYRQLGVEWLLVGDAHRALEGSGYFPELLAEHGEPVFGDGGFDLYRLVDSPASGQVVSCDPTFAGRVPCWTGSLDGSPGLTAGESPGGAIKSVPVCPGQTLAVDVRTAPGDADTNVYVLFDDSDPIDGTDIAVAQPGTLSRTLATAPLGSTTATVVVQPRPGAAALSAEVRAFGPACPVP